MASEFPEITDIRKRRYLAALAETGSLSMAAAASKVPVRTARHWKTMEGVDGDLYRKALAEAMEIAAEKLEEEARRRAADGLKRFKFHKGEPVIDPTTGKPYYELEYSDTLLIFLLKGAMPHKYQERTEHSFNPQAPPVSLDEVIKECGEFLAEQKEPETHDSNDGSN